MKLIDYKCPSCGETITDVDASEKAPVCKCGVEMHKRPWPTNKTPWKWNDK